MFIINSSFLPLTQALTALLSDDSKFGFIVIDGSGALFGTLQGNTREVLHKFTVDLPKKHGTEPEFSYNTKHFFQLHSRNCQKIKYYSVVGCETFL